MATATKQQIAVLLVEGLKMLQCGNGRGAAERLLRAHELAKENKTSGEELISAILEVTKFSAS